MLIINNDENICVSVDRNDVSVCGRKRSGCSNDEHMAEGQTDRRLGAWRWSATALPSSTCPTHLLVRSHDSLHLMFKSHTPSMKPSNSNNPQVSCHLKSFLQSTGSKLRPLHTSARIIPWLTECCHMLKVLLSQHSSNRVKKFSHYSLLKIWESSFWNFAGQHKDVPNFVLVLGNSQKSVCSLQHNFYQQPFKASACSFSFRFTMQSLTS